MQNINYQYIESAKNFCISQDGCYSTSNAQHIAYIKFIEIKMDILENLRSRYPFMFLVVDEAEKNPCNYDVNRLYAEYELLITCGDMCNLYFNDPHYMAMVGAYLALFVHLDPTPNNIGPYSSVVNYLNQCEPLEGEYRDLVAFMLVWGNYQGFLNNLLSSMC